MGVAMLTSILVSLTLTATFTFDIATRTCRDAAGEPGLNQGSTPGPCVDLSGAQLASASLSGRDLRGARFDGADLTRADLSGAELTGASFVGANLTRAVLTGATLVAASFDRARLNQALLQHARLEGASLRGTDARLACVFGTSLRSADLRGARFSTYAGALSGARLEGAQVDDSTVMPKSSFAQADASVAVSVADVK